MAIEGKIGKATPGKKLSTKGKSQTPARATVGGELSDAQLKEWAQRDAAAMAQLIAIIPAAHLKPQEHGREIAKKYMKKVKDTVSDKVARAANEKRAKKRAKFDGSEPTNGKDASDSEDEDDHANASDSENDEEMSEDSGEEEAPAGQRGRAPQGAGGGAVTGSAQLKPTHRAKSREELQELLAKKMQQFAGKRKKEDDGGAEKASEARKRKREEKKDKKKKLKAKEKQKQTSVPIPSPMPKEKSAEERARSKAEGGGDEAFTFGRIKMGGEDVVGGGKDKNKKYREQPEKLLKKIEDKQRKLEELGGAGSEEGKKFVERQKWGASIDRAQGVKVKDDAGLLRKTITKAAKVKAKRAEKWTKRATDIEDSRTKRIEQRNDNIKKRIQDRRDKKMGIKKKKTKAK